MLKVNLQNNYLITNISKCSVQKKFAVPESLALKMINIFEIETSTFI